MLIKRYLSILLFAPLLLCMILVAFDWLTSNSLSYVNLGRILFPYTLFSYLLYLWMQNITPGAIRRVVYRLPIIFLFIEIFYLSGEKVLGLPGALDFVGLTAVVSMLAVFVIVFGYIYIFIAEIGYIALMQQYRFDQHDKTGRKMSLHC